MLLYYSIIYLYIFQHRNYEPRTTTNIIMKKKILTQEMYKNIHKYNHHYHVVITNIGYDENNGMQLEHNNNTKMADSTEQYIIEGQTLEISMQFHSFFFSKSL